MTVKKFLSSYNIGRSHIQRIIVVDVNSGDDYEFSKTELIHDSYGRRGDLKINTFTITADSIVIYAR